MTDPIPARAVPVGPDGAHDQTEDASCAACGKPFSPLHDDRTTGPRVRHPFKPAAAPRANPNVGELPGGGFWASFCDHDECSILGCPGDCRSERS